MARWISGAFGLAALVIISPLEAANDDDADPGEPLWQESPVEEPSRARAPSARFRPAPVLPYKEGDPVPVGYHVEDRARKGPTVVGIILTAVPYGIGVMGATAASFRNSSGWLAVPYAGPWLTLGRRSYGCDGEDRPGEESVDCVGDVFVTMGLVTSGLIQTAGGLLLIIGQTATKSVLVRDQAKTLIVTPTRIANGYGLSVGGAF